MRRWVCDVLLVWVVPSSSSPIFLKYTYTHTHTHTHAVCSYVALFPNNESAKLIIQSGIKEVVYMSDAQHDEVAYVASRRLLEMAKVITRQFIPTKQQITIDFSIPETANGMPASGGSANSAAGSDASAALPAAAAPPPAAATGGGSTIIGGGGESVRDEVNERAWWAGNMSREECGHLVMSAHHGDFLIRALPSGDRSICVNDKGSARFYTITADKSTPGRWYVELYAA